MSRKRGALTIEYHDGGPVFVMAASLEDVFDKIKEYEKIEGWERGSKQPITITYSERRGIRLKITIRKYGMVRK